MTVTDDTKAGARAFSPEGRFWPKVAYAPETGHGMGGFPSYAVANEGAGGDGGDDGGDGGDGGADDKVDPKRDIDDPAADMYPDQSKAKDDKTDKTKAKDDDKSKDKAKDKTKAKDDDKSKDKSKAKDDDDADDEDEDDADDKDDEDKDDDDADVDLNTVPEDGKYKLKMPDGMELDQDLLDEMAPLWKEKGLTHADAQALTDKYIAAQTKNGEKAAEAWDQTVTDWAKQTKADKEIGGKKFDASITMAKATLNKYGTPELKAALDNSGMGSHPEVIRLLVNFAKATTDDEIPNPKEQKRQAGSNTNADDAEELYGETTPLTKG